MTPVGTGIYGGSNSTGIARIAVLVVQDLFYPATLGALLYNFASLFDDCVVWRSKPLSCLSVILILVYFTIDYVWTKDWVKNNKYTIIAAFCDAVALILILLTERLIDPISGTDDPAHVARAALYLAIVHLFYTIWCVFEEMESHKVFKALFTVLFAFDCLLAFNEWHLSMLSFVVLQVLLCIGYVNGMIPEGWWVPTSRISYATATGALQEACTRIQRFCGNLQ